MLHGDRDSVIPFAWDSDCSIDHRPEEFVAIPGGDHNDAVPRDPGRYWDAIRRFIATLSPRGGG